MKEHSQSEIHIKSWAADAAAYLVPIDQTLQNVPSWQKEEN